MLNNTGRKTWAIFAAAGIVALLIAINFLLASRDGTTTDISVQNKGITASLGPTSAPIETASAPRVLADSASAQSRPNAMRSVESKPVGGMRSWDKRPPQKLIVKVLDSLENPCADLTVKIAANTRDPDIRFQSRPTQAVTDIDGKAIFEDWPIGFGVKVEVNPNKEKKLFFKEKSVYPSSVATEFEIVMRAGAVGGLRGQLRMRSTAAPIAGAVELFVEKSFKPLQTDPAGQFEFTALPIGDWTLKAGTADSQLFESPFTIRAGETTDMGWIDLDEGILLAGIVVDENGRALEGIHLDGPSRPLSHFPRLDTKKIRVYGASWTVTDAKGFFRLPAVRSGAKSWISASDRRPRGVDSSQDIALPLTVGNQPTARPRIQGTGVSQTFGPFTAPDENLRIVFENQAEVIVELIDPISGDLLTTGQIDGYCMKNGKMIPIGSFHSVDPADSKYHILVTPTEELVLQAFSAAGEFGHTVRKFAIPSGQPVVNLQMVTEHNLVVKMKVGDSEGSPMFMFPIHCKYGPEGKPSTIIKNTDFDGNVTFTSLGRTLIFEVNEEGFELWTHAVIQPSRNDIDLGTIILKRR